MEPHFTIPVSPRPHGVYVIENRITHTLYVGRTASTRKDRWRIHRSELRGNRHFNKYLQSAWNKYGESSFEFYILDDDPNEEGFYIEYFRYIGVELYNLTTRTSARGGQVASERSGLRRGTRTGARLSDETKARLSKARKGMKLRPDWIEKTTRANSKVFPGFIAPDGTIHRNVFNLRSFCRTHGLSSGTMNRVAHGHRTHYKGWRRLVEDT